MPDNEHLPLLRDWIITRSGGGMTIEGHDINVPGKMCRFTRIEGIAGRQADILSANWPSEAVGRCVRGGLVICWLA